MTTMTPACVDEEIDKCLVLLSDLRAQKNSFLPIFRLPPETLANIFAHYARSYHESNTPPHSFCHRVPRWVNVSYVCRHWRNVALSCPMLWTYHFTISLRWTEELLTRSKQALLKIRIDSGNAFGLSRILEKVLDHAERIQELRLAVPGSVLPRELSLYAPHLQVLDIYAWDATSLTIKYGDIPPLRTLKLTDCPLPWHSLNLSGVTTLSLCRVPALSQQNITEFLATLRRMEALTVLLLDDALAAPRGEAFSAFPKAGLPCLIGLYIAAPLSTIIALLSCIDIPLKAQVKLENLYEDRLSIDDYAQIPSVLTQRFNQTQDPTSSSPTIRSLVIRSPLHEPRFTFSSECGVCDSQLSVACPPWDCNVPLMIRVRIGLSMDTTDRERIINDICCSIPSTHVHTLHVVDPPYSDDFWTATLSHFEGVRFMKLSDGYMPDLTSFLAPADKPLKDSSDISSDYDLNPSLAFLPVLEKLELHGITFAFEEEDPGSEGSLLDALSTREALRPVQLTTIGCDTEEEEEEEEEEESDMEYGVPTPFLVNTTF